MKIIHTFRICAEGYGLERNILCTLPGLAERGVDVVALAVTERRLGQPPSPEFTAQLDEAKVRLITIAVEGRLPFELSRRFSEIFAREKPDVIHSHDYKCDLATLLSKTGGAVRMTTVHGWCSRDFKERFYEWLNVQCCKRLDASVVFCEDYRQRLTRRGVRHDRVHVVPVGLDKRVVPGEGIDFRAKWSINPDAPLVAQLGRLSPEKRPDVFVRTAAALKPQFPEARFVLVGDGESRNELLLLIDSLGISDRVILSGYVHGMADVLGAIDIIVNCSSTESMPRTLLEAGLAELPVVATAVGGVPDIVRDGVTGIVCSPNKIAAIKTGTARLLGDRSLRRQMGRAARQHIEERFNVASCSERLIRLYDQLLARSGMEDSRA